MQTPTTIASTSALEATSEVIRVKEDIAARISPIGGSSDVNQKFIHVRSSPATDVQPRGLEALNLTKSGCTEDPVENTF